MYHSLGISTEILCFNKILSVFTILINYFIFMDKTGNNQLKLLKQ